MVKKKDCMDSIISLSLTISYLRILCVMVGEPLQRVDSREMVVDTDWEDLPVESGVAPGPPGVPTEKANSQWLRFNVYPCCFII